MQNTFYSNICSFNGLYCWNHNTHVHTLQPLCSWHHFQADTVSGEQYELTFIGHLYLSLHKGFWIKLELSQPIISVLPTLTHFMLLTIYEVDAFIFPVLLRRKLRHRKWSNCSSLHSWKVAEMGFESRSSGSSLCSLPLVPCFLNKDYE